MLNTHPRVPQDKLLLLTIVFAFTPTPSPQVVLINAVRDVAKALAELIGATKCAAGKAADDPSMYQLKSAAKVLTAPMEGAHGEIFHSVSFYCRVDFNVWREGKSNVTGPISVCVALCFGAACVRLDSLLRWLIP